MYNSDTVYSTTTFRPVSPLPSTPPAPGPTQRTRKLETPLHYDGGLFSDIRSADGKLLSKVTVDSVHSTSRCDVIDSPNVSESFAVDPQGNRDYVGNIVKTESITNEDVIKIKFTPVPAELSTPRTITPVLTQKPIPYIKDNFEDLQSYKMVSMMCKEKKLASSDKSTDSVSYLQPRPQTPIMFMENKMTSNLEMREKHVEDLHFQQQPRPHTPLANLEVAEQLSKINSYLQESLDACSGGNQESRSVSRTSAGRGETKESTINEERRILEEKHLDNINKTYQEASTSATPIQDEKSAKYEMKSKLNSVEVKTQSVWKSIYNMPIHYHAAILCFILIIYNLIYQYIKENCHGKIK